MTNGDVSNAELARRLDRIDAHLGNIEKQFDENVARLRHRANNQEMLITANRERLNAQHDRLEAVERTMNKLIWGLIGALSLVLLQAAVLVGQTVARGGF